MENFTGLNFCGFNPKKFSWEYFDGTLAMQKHLFSIIKERYLLPACCLVINKLHAF